jgi:CheY-like chemotaxis protein
MIFKKRGFDCRTAYTGFEAVASADEFCPELLLCDISMPGMSGLEVVSKVTAKCPDCRVLLLTGRYTNLGFAQAWDVASRAQPHHDQACTSSTFTGSRRRSAAIPSTVKHVHAEAVQAYTEKDAGTGTIADFRRRLHCHSGRVRVARAKAGPASRPFARRHCVERQACFGLFPLGDLPAAQPDSVAASLCSESLSPLIDGRLRRMRRKNQVRCSASAMLDSSLRYLKDRVIVRPMTNRWFTIL